MATPLASQPGAEASGRPRVLLLHGFLSGSSIWGPLRRELGETVEVCAPDLLGYGTNRNSGSEYSLDRLVDDLEPAVERFRPTHIVGHSMGGIVALSLARRHPGAFERLGIAGLPIFRDRADGLRYLHRRGIPHRLMLARDHISHFGCDTLYRARSLWAFTASFWVPHQPREHVLAAFNHTFESHTGSLSAICFAGHVPRLVAGLQTPVAALHGGKDAAAPVERVRALAAEHGWDFRLAPTGSHQLVVERPALTARWARERVLRIGSAAS